MCASPPCGPALALTACCAAVAASSFPTIKLGAAGYYSSSARIYQLMDFAAKAALEDGFLDDVVLNRSFRVDIKAVHTACSGTVAAEVIPPLLFGTGPSPGRIMSDKVSDPVVAIAGCGCSSSTKVAATFSLRTL